MVKENKMNIIEKLGISASPWEVIEDDMGYQLEGNYGESIAYMEVPKDPNDSDRQLIASAPEMLEFIIKNMYREIDPDPYPCYDVCNYCGDSHESHYVDCEGIKIIQKATNKSWEQIKELLND